MSDAAQPAPSNPNALSPLRSEATRRRGSLNARTHGLTARLPKTEEEASAMKQFADHWTKELGPDTKAQEALIRASASAFARVERARKIEEETMRQSSLDAAARWEKRKRHQVRAKAQELAKDPLNTVADLECSSFGCEWLMRNWSKLDGKLAQGIPWQNHDIELAMRLSGLVPLPPGPDADPFSRVLWGLCRMVAGFPGQPGLGLPGDILAARVELRKLIAAEFGRLDQVREELWEQLDGPEAEAVAHRGLEDVTKEGQLRKRYAKEAFSQMTRALALVMKIRVENGKFADRLWWQAHAEHRKPRGVSPFHHPEAMPTCVIPDPRRSPSPSAPVDPPNSRNEPHTEAVSASHPRPNTRPEKEIRNEPSARDSMASERSLPEWGPSKSALPAVPSPVEPPVWPADAPIRV